MWFKIPLLVRYSAALIVGLVLLRTLDAGLLSWRFSADLYTGLISLFFLVVGIAVGITWLRLQRHQLSTAQVNKAKLPILTVKEKRILYGLVQGKTNQQLAEDAFLSVNTIKTHLKSIYKKLEVNNRSEAAAKAELLNLKAP